jgi:hypothetical protein
MRRNSIGRHDPTGEAAIGHVLGDAMIDHVRSKINDEDLALLIAHIAIGQPLSSLANEQAAVYEDVASRIKDALRTLGEDEDLCALDGVIRAGDPASHHALIYQLGLQHWFCSTCGTYLPQLGIGRPRKTCSARCRARLHRARNATQMDREEYPPPAATTGSLPSTA